MDENIKYGKSANTQRTAICIRRTSIDGHYPKRLNTTIRDGLLESIPRCDYTVSMCSSNFSVGKIGKSRDKGKFLTKETSIGVLLVSQLTDKSHISTGSKVRRNWFGTFDGLWRGGESFQAQVAKFMNIFYQLYVLNFLKIFQYFLWNVLKIWRNKTAFFKLK